MAPEKVKIIEEIVIVVFKVRTSDINGLVQQAQKVRYDGQIHYAYGNGARVWR